MFFSASLARPAAARSSSTHAGCTQCSLGMRPKLTDAFVAARTALRPSAPTSTLTRGGGHARAELGRERGVVEEDPRVPEVRVEAPLERAHRGQHAGQVCVTREHQ
jgi:hypothetical protein